MQHRHQHEPNQDRAGESAEEKGLHTKNGLTAETPAREARYCGGGRDRSFSGRKRHGDALDAIDDHWTDDIDHRAVEGAIDDRGPIHGKDALRAYLRDWLDALDELTVEPVELIDAGEDKVVAVLRASGRAKMSGLETDLTYAVVYTIGEGRSRGAAST